jgi:hypothetical protein
MQTAWRYVMNEGIASNHYYGDVDDSREQRRHRT